MTAPFRAGRTRLRALLRRFSRDPVGAAYEEIRVRLAEASHVRDVSSADVAAIAQRWQVSLEGPLATRTLSFYGDFLRHCLDDHKLTHDEVEDLDHLRRSLHLDRDDVEYAHRRVAREIYSRTVDEVLADSTIDDAERAFLTELRDRLGLPDIVAENIEEMKAMQRGARDAIPPKRADLD